ncbi:MAG: hypothetical protein AB1553_02090 [Nitrospirota bacterium]
MLALSIATKGYWADNNTLSIATGGYRRRLSQVSSDRTVSTAWTRCVCIDRTFSGDRRKAVVGYGSLHVDFLQNNNLILRNVVLSYDFVKAFYDAAVMPVEYRLGVQRDASLQLDRYAPLHADAMMRTDFLKAVRPERTFPAAYEKARLMSVVIPCDARASRSATVILPFDGLKRPVIDHLLLFDIITKLDKDVQLPIGITGSWGKVVFLHPAGAVHFYRRPLKQQPQGFQMFQPSGRDSNGDFYSTTKSTLRIRDEQLAFRNISDYTIESLRYFILNAARGTKNKFTYFDVYNVPHTAKFTERKFSWRRTGYNKNDLVIYLEVYL